MTSVVGGDDFNNNTYFFLCGALKLSLNRQDSYPNTQPSCTSWQAAFIDKAEEFCSDLGEKGSCPRFRELDSLGHRSEEVLTQKGESVFFFATVLSFCNEKGVSQHMWLVYLKDNITSTITHNKDTYECSV